MAKKKLINVTKASIVRVATEKFLRDGFTTTTVKNISDELGISTGHVTFYYPSKVHLLAVLVDMLCKFQWNRVVGYNGNYEENLAASSLELTAMAALCEENEVARDFYLSAYSNAMTVDIIRRNDYQRGQTLFTRYCPDWTETMFAEAELLVSGIEYATLMATESSPPLEVRIRGGLDQIYRIYNIPDDLRKQLIDNALQQDYHSIGRQIFNEFIAYIKHENEQTLETLLNMKQGAKK